MSRSLSTWISPSGPNLPRGCLPQWYIAEARVAEVANPEAPDTRYQPMIVLVRYSTYETIEWRGPCFPSQEVAQGWVDDTKPMFFELFKLFKNALGEYSA